MASIVLVESSFAYLFVNYLRSAGYPVREWLQEAMLPMSLLSNPHGQVSESRLRQFIEAAASRTRTNDLGLKVAETTSMAVLGDLAVQMRKQPDLLTCLQRFCEGVIDLNSHARFWICSNNDQTWFCRSNPVELENARNYAEQFTVAFMIKLVQMKTDPDWYPQQIHLQTSLLEPYIKHAIFSKSEILRQQPITAITIPAAFNVDDAPLQPMEVSVPNQSLADGLARLLKPYLPDKCMKVGDTAMLIGLTERTLKRRLRDEGTSYREILQQLRFETASDLLAGTNDSLLEIAAAVAYTSPGNFSRAFQRLSGMTPGEYRARQHKR